jgi:phosphoenolpyruvate carboxylase
MKISEQDAADLLSEVLLENNPLNDQFIELVENVHMKQRMTGVTFVLKSRDAKDKYINSQFKNTLNELLGDASYYSSEIVLRKLIISQIALELAQNLGIDYHAATEELYYYMRKKDTETNNEVMQLIKSVIDKTGKNRRI